MKYFWWVFFVALALSFLVSSFLPGSKGGNATEETISTGILHFPIINELKLSSLTLRKIGGHFLYNFLIGLTGYYSLLALVNNRLKSLRYMLLISLLIACCGEFFQLFSTGRYPTMTDVAINYTGGLLSLFFVYVISQYQFKTKNDLGAKSE